jgi:hypothetical protein
VGWGIIFLCFLSLYWRSPANPNGRVPQDFATYLRASERLGRNTDPYVVEDEHPYKYPPGFLVPIQLLPQDPKKAWHLFGVMSLAAWAMALFLGTSLNTWKQVGLLILGLILSWKGVLETLDFGQVEFLLLFILTLSALLWKRLPWVAGVLTGTLPWVKLPWAFFIVPFLILMGRRNAKKGLISYGLGYGVACLLWFIFLPVLVFGVDKTVLLTQGWISIVRLQPKSLYFSDFNQGLFVAIFECFGFGTEFSWFALLLTFLIGLLVGIPLAKRTLTTQSYESALGWMAPWMLLGQLLNPLGWRWGSILLIGIPFSLEWHTLIRKKEYRNCIFAFGFCLWLSQQNPVTQLFHLHWTSLHAYRNITLYWMAWLLLAI